MMILRAGSIQELMQTPQVFADAPGLARRCARCSHTLVRCQPTWLMR